MISGPGRYQAASGKRSLAVATLAVAAALTLPACGSPSASTAGESPATVEAVDGAKVKRVTLTQRASERIGIKTNALSEEMVAGQSMKVVPYAAVLYDNEGATWVFTMSQPLTYMREQVTVEDIKADNAYLSAGPAMGTAVVSVGASLLYGTELGVGK